MQGTVQARGRQPLLIKFMPSATEEYEEEIHIEWADRYNEIIPLRLKGSGGHTQVHQYHNM